MAAPVRLISCLRVCRVQGMLSNGGHNHYPNLSTYTQSGFVRQLSSKPKFQSLSQYVQNGQVSPYKHFTFSKLGCIRTFTSRCSQNTSDVHLGQRGLLGKRLLQQNTHRSQPSRRTFQHVNKDRKTKGSFRKKMSEQGGGGVGGGNTLVKSFAFTAGVCLCSFTGCMIWCYEDTRSQAQRFERHLRTYSTDRSQKIGFRRDMEHIWSQIPPGVKAVAGIIAANLAVYAMWRAPALLSTMKRYFVLSTDNPRISMLLSSFSHFNFVHIFMNMYVFWSFKDIASKLGREQFMAVYLSAAVVSSLLSQVHIVARALPINSLGASGALMAILGMYWHFLPDGRLCVPFVSSVFPHSFSLDTGVKFLLTMDTLGLILGWQKLDHAGHIGGLLFGYWYAKYGRELIWNRRYLVINKWRRFRE
ncbi:presenilins-associated rhomboid-like protein, mitochondrial isoform X15 [Pecten maximus]|uniref:presenilins-associated rhomboid-like protein, mitochondrial isoform X15 n=1 Tax=Pecten maximus TaxID=6579 RepID=UPI0014586CC4|nr:presenilins-associated rhomboid-like protein, mitochondrial isoform X15 [Pecten maximus]XP_033760861.1 presenilins-associated rhomboid-like protein, mitochondrial isoform X15 [Pecten maximus]